MKNNGDRYKSIVEYLIEVGVTEKTSGIEYIADIIYMLFNEDDGGTTCDEDTYRMFKLCLWGYTLEEIAKEFGISKETVRRKLKLNGQFVKFNLNGRVYPEFAETFGVSTRNIKRVVNYAITKLYEKTEHTELYEKLFGNQHLTDKVFIRKSYVYLKEQGV